jgi:glyoxylase-like metal-dependent hydrolase (beta-lactamase superfamily II)
MVDAQYAQIYDKVLAAIRKISPEPIRFLVNTHVHGDHTAGNANFVKVGALLFAREELREEMLRPPGAGNASLARDPARDPARLPVVTYGMGGRCIWPANFSNTTPASTLCMCRTRVRQRLQPI